MPPRWLRALLVIYPRSLRRDHADDIALAIAEDLHERRGWRARLRWWRRLLVDAAATWSPGSPSGSPSPAPRRRGLPVVADDVRAAARLFRQAPLVALGAALTLGLGIGAATAVFSLADATLLRPLPVPRAYRILQSDFSWSHPDYRDLARTQLLFSDVIAWSSPSVGLERHGQIAPVAAVASSGNFARALALQPILGRMLDERDDQPGAPLTAVLSERLWTRLFARDPATVGATVELNRRAVQVVGIFPAEFRGLSLAEAPEILLPLATIPQVATGFLSRPGMMANRDAVWLRVAGRLRDEATPEAAEAEVATIYRTLHPASEPNRPPEQPRMTPLPVVAARMETVDDLRRFVIVLGGAALATLLLATATVANLLLVRAERRERELAVRTALGAGRFRLARLLLLESLLIGLAGAAIGVLVSQGAVTLLAAFSLPGSIPVADLALTVNGTVLGIAAALGVATSLVFGVAPLWRTSRLDVTEVLRGSQGHSVRQPLRAWLVTIQVALSVLLLAGGLAFGRAVREAFTLDLGFDTNRTAFLTFNPSLVRNRRADTAALQERTLDNLARQPWVRAAGWAAVRPLAGRMQWHLGVPDYTPRDPNEMYVDSNVVTPGYLEALGIPLRDGRLIDGSDRATSPRIGVVSEAFARKFLANRPALGARLNLDVDQPQLPASWITVVGVVGDIRRGIDRDIEPMMYLPLAQHPATNDFGMFLFVAANGISPEAAAKETAATIRGFSPLAPITREQSMRSHLSTAAMVPRLGFTLFALFASLAIVLTTIGVYAVVASAVTRRRREIGIRVALGASSQRVLRLVLTQAARPTLAGLAIGTLTYWFSSHALQTFLVKIPAFDALLVLGLVAGMTAVALVAIVVPSRRALSVDPAITLRAE